MLNGKFYQTTSKGMGIPIIRYTFYMVMSRSLWEHVLQLGTWCLHLDKIWQMERWFLNSPFPLKVLPLEAPVARDRYGIPSAL